jgi:sugar phosphate isomerase/epimerase
LFLPKTLWSRCRAAGHIHLKDVQARSGGYYFVPIGEGDLDCAKILQALKSRPDLNLAIEVPLRFHRNLAAQPCRSESPVNISEIESVLRKSLDFVHGKLVWIGPAPAF